MRKRILFSLLFLFGACAISVVDDAKAVEAESTLHGQFRINSYYQTSSDGKTTIGGNLAEADDIQAARLRFRPTWDVKFDNGVAMHMQLNIGHINSNIANARYTLNGSSGNDPAVSLRHGYISAPVPSMEELTLTAGIIPISDKFGDTLFSSDWDYNPLAFMLTGTFSGVKVRLGHANLDEGGEGTSITNAADDVDQWFVDADTDTSVGMVGVSYYGLNDNTKPTNSRTGGASTTNQHYVGVRYTGTFDSVEAGGWVLYNWGVRKFPSGVTDRDNSGVAVKGEVKAGVGPAKVGLMALYASGDKDFSDSTKSSSDSFITPESIVGTTGYWGYTGKLNVQGPTDTGIDCQAVNIDGADYCTGAGIGNGMVTVQANIAAPIIEGRLDGYAAVGWFKSVDSLSGQKKYIGTDIYAQLKYFFSEHMALEAGVDYVALGKGHPDNLENAPFTSVDRGVTLLFSRLQLEY